MVSPRGGGGGGLFAVPIPLFTATTCHLGKTQWHATWRRGRISPAIPTCQCDRRRGRGGGVVFVGWHALILPHSTARDSDLPLLVMANCCQSPFTCTMTHRPVLGRKVGGGGGGLGARTPAGRSANIQTWAVSRFTERSRSLEMELCALYSPNWSRGGVAVRLFASHLWEPGSIPGGVAHVFSHVGIVPDDAASRRVFSRFSRFPRPCIPAQVYANLIGSQDGHYAVVRRQQCSPIALARPEPRPQPYRTSLGRIGSQGEGSSGAAKIHCSTHGMVARGMVTNPSGCPANTRREHARQGGCCYSRKRWPYEILTGFGRLLTARSREPIEVRMEQRRNERAGETGDPRESPSTSGIIRHDYHMRKTGSGIEPGSVSLSPFHSCLLLVTAGYPEYHLEEWAGVAVTSCGSCFGNFRTVGDAGPLPLRCPGSDRDAEAFQLLHIRLKCHGGRCCVVVRLLASYKGEPSSIPGGVTPRFSHVVIMVDDAAIWWVFLRISRFPSPFHSGAAPYSPRFTLMGNQELAVKSRSNLFTHSLKRSAPDAYVAPSTDSCSGLLPFNNCRRLTVRGEKLALGVTTKHAPPETRDAQPQVCLWRGYAYPENVRFFFVCGAGSLLNIDKQAVRSPLPPPPPCEPTHHQPSVSLVKTVVSFMVAHANGDVSPLEKLLGVESGKPPTLYGKASSASL
ncbi:hypothetical protein PR048_007190 [Dryococelus australis]|uniref:Uncharacterized protein n=1 Tax=Dryococelus australis TaxID=614101 RepID=A0ABQ9IF41_9NEOP|nr:hypothetical protein PR048_007190 [Dryococelus australis]